MRIFLNDDAHDVERGTLAAALEVAGLWRPQDRDRGERPLRRRAARADDERSPTATAIEVVAPMQGG